MAHRRIRINEHHIEEEANEIPILKDEKGEAGVVDEEVKEKQEIKDERLLIGNTDNVLHKEFETTEEIKAMTQVGCVQYTVSLKHCLNGSTGSTSEFRKKHGNLKNTA